MSAQDHNFPPPPLEDDAVPLIDIEAPYVEAAAQDMPGLRERIDTFRSSERGQQIERIATHIGREAAIGAGVATGMIGVHEDGDIRLQTVGIIAVAKNPRAALAIAGAGALGGATHAIGQELRTATSGYFDFQPASETAQSETPGR